MPDVDRKRTARQSPAVRSPATTSRIVHGAGTPRCDESTFASYRGIAREKLANFWLTWPLQVPLSWAVDDDYSPVDAIGRVSPIPVLIIHGDWTAPCR
jgi:hypothetical protein